MKRFFNLDISLHFRQIQHSTLSFIHLKGTDHITLHTCCEEQCFLFYNCRVTGALGEREPAHRQGEVPGLYRLEEFRFHPITYHHCECGRSCDRGAVYYGALLRCSHNLPPAEKPKSETRDATEAVTQAAIWAQEKRVTVEAVVVHTRTLDFPLRLSW